ncbi:hypothetical protein BT93_B1125 [Corymbia citriodora subsp. variegata]|nr:hypothetical protein BT93_B1125 [Corymbia citriodora subsp. variegata]
MDDDRALVCTEPEPKASLVAHAPPLAASYNDWIRPLLDAINRLRNLMSSGKSSVLKSLDGIKLPQGQGICTRVPLIMQLQNNPQADRPQLYLEFNGKVIPTEEDNIAKAINDATAEIVGHGKGVSKTPLTMVIKKYGIPGLTWSTCLESRVPMHSGPENIYKQILKMIMEYIRPEESIILNVLSATVDFSTCESMRMSQMVDKTGRRTLVVVTRADKAPEGLLEKVTANDVNIGLGYVCVRSRIGAETHEEARLEVAELFDTHPLLCKINKSFVGVPVLAQKLTQIQTTIIAKYLPEIVVKINNKPDANVAELKTMPKNLSSVKDAMVAFMEIMGSAKKSLRKVLLRGEIDEYLDEDDMYCTARLAKMLNQYCDELQNGSENNLTTNFLLEEIKVLKEVEGIGLPDFLPRTAFLILLKRKVKGISTKPASFVARVWDYIEGVVIWASMRHSENYPQLLFKMEKLIDYTCNPEYLLARNKLMAWQDHFFSHYKSHDSISIEGIGAVKTVHLCNHNQQLLQQAFDLKMRMIPYRKIVLRRFVNSVALHLRFSLQNLVNKEMEKEIRGERTGHGIKRMMEETPEVAEKREELNRSIKQLRESAEVVAKFMD